MTKIRWSSGVAPMLVPAILFWAATVSADFNGRVVAVKDGDSIVVLNNRTQVKVRLYGIDCPEKGQAFGQNAKQFASNLVFGKRVSVRERDLDHYGRTVAEVILPDGRNLGHELVRAGMAWWYRQYAKKDARMKAMEKEAHIAKVGLWTDPDPVPPWKWRKERRSR